MKILSLILFIFLSTNVFAIPGFITGFIQSDNSLKQYIIDETTNVRYELKHYKGALTLSQKVAIPIAKNNIKISKNTHELIDLKINFLPFETTKYFDYEKNTVEFYFMEQLNYHSKKKEGFNTYWGHGAVRVGDRVYNFNPNEPGMAGYYRTGVSVVDLFFGMELGYSFARNIWSLRFQLSKVKLNQLIQHLDKVYGKYGGETDDYDKLSFNCLSPLKETLSFLDIKEHGRKNFTPVQPFHMLKKLRYHLPNELKKRKKHSDLKYIGEFYYPQTWIAKKELNTLTDYYANKEIITADLSSTQSENLKEYIELIEEELVLISEPALSFFDPLNINAPELKQKYQNITDKWLELSEELTHVNIQNYLDLFSLDKAELTLKKCDGTVASLDESQRNHLKKYYYTDEYSDKTLRDLVFSIKTHLRFEEKLNTETRLTISNYLNIPLKWVGEQYPIIKINGPSQLIELVDTTDNVYFKSLERKPRSRSINRLENMCKDGNTSALKILGKECKHVQDRTKSMKNLQTFIDLVMNNGIRYCADGR
ncbi:MAG: hypothetical protein HOO06_07850 [Bdellovibrionaceae bacterium]|jgi:hypothetical protein|nr:hypothetical protein [Pseudobdellovibrionaceae bacterium]